MAYEVEYTDEFEEWWNQLNEDEQATVDAYVKMLEQYGIGLGYPYSSNINQSRYGQMRELRAQHQGRPYRVLYAFDPRRTAILLVGGDKTGDDRWYDKFVPVADNLYEEHLKSLEKEKSNNG